jgi:hypothetical protein
MAMGTQQPPTRRVPTSNEGGYGGKNTYGYVNGKILDPTVWHRWIWRYKTHTHELVDLLCLPYDTWTPYVIHYANLKCRLLLTYCASVLVLETCCLCL